MKKLFRLSRLFLGMSLILAGWSTARAEICFTANLKQDVTPATCGPIEAQVNIRDCATRDVQKTFEATMGLNCRATPRTLNLLYEGNMLVGQMTNFDESGDYILSHTFVKDVSRAPASFDNKRTRGDRCFSSVVLDKPDEQLCLPVHARFQLRDCETGSPVNEAFEVVAHYNCKTHQISYWYKDSLLVGTVKNRSGRGFEVANTQAWVYEQIYGSVDQPPRRPAASSEVPADSTCSE